MIREDGLPVGLGFGLATNEDAMNHFSAMTEEEKKRVIEVARSMQTREEMRHLVQDIADMGRAF